MLQGEVLQSPRRRMQELEGEAYLVQGGVVQEALQDALLQSREVALLERGGAAACYALVVGLYVLLAEDREALQDALLPEEGGPQ